MILMFLVSVIRPELSTCHDKFPCIIFGHIYQTLGNHKWNPIFRIAKSLNENIYHIESFSKYFMTKCESGCHLSHNCYLVVFNNLIGHNLSLSSLLYFFVFIILFYDNGFITIRLDIPRTFHRQKSTARSASLIFSVFFPYYVFF